MKETLELIDKYGIKPIIFIIIAYLYAENQQNKADIKEVQSLLVDCYKSQTRLTNLTNNDTLIINPIRLVAILPCNPIGRIQKNGVDTKYC
jgi:hypothetical protein